MKQIEILDKTYLYEVIHRESDYTSWSGTYFYKPTPIIKTRKKYIFWGPEVSHLEYEGLFSMTIDIESERYTKKDITQRILNEIALLNRKEEIKRGEIIATQEDAKIFIENITNPPAPNDKLKEAGATHIKQYTDKDMTNFVSFVGKNYIKAKGFYYMKGDFEKKHKLSIHQILAEFKEKNLEVKK
jgi:uncharacterized protein (DUF1778 family)